MSEFVDICKVSDIPIGEARMILVNDVAFGIFNVSGHSLPSMMLVRMQVRHCRAASLKETSFNVEFIIGDFVCGTVSNASSRRASSNRANQRIIAELQPETRSQTNVINRYRNANPSSNGELVGRTSFVLGGPKKPRRSNHC